MEVPVLAITEARFTLNPKPFPVVLFVFWLSLHAALDLKRLVIALFIREIFCDHEVLSIMKNIKTYHLVHCWATEKYNTTFHADNPHVYA